MGTAMVCFLYFCFLLFFDFFGLFTIIIVVVVRCAAIIFLMNDNTVCIRIRHNNTKKYTTKNALAIPQSVVLCP